MKSRRPNNFKKRSMDDPKWIKDKPHVTGIDEDNISPKLKNDVEDKIKEVSLRKEHLVKELKCFAFDNVGLNSLEKKVIRLKEKGDYIIDIAKKLGTNRWQVSRIYKRAYRKIKKFIFFIAPDIPSLAHFDYSAIDRALGGLMIYDVKRIKGRDGNAKLGFKPSKKKRDIKYYLNNLKNESILRTLKPGVTVPFIDFLRYRAGGNTKYKAKVRSVRISNKRVTEWKANEFIDNLSVEEIIDYYRKPAAPHHEEHYNELLKMHHFPVAKKRKNELAE